MRKPTYVLTQQAATRCPECNSYTSLLMHRFGIHKPVFWLCWGCRKVFESGKGEVPST